MQLLSTNQECCQGIRPRNLWNTRPPHWLPCSPSCGSSTLLYIHEPQPHCSLEKQLVQLAAVGNSRQQLQQLQQLAAVGSNWQALAAVGNSWQQLAAVGSSWQSLVRSSWRQLAASATAAQYAPK